MSDEQTFRKDVGSAPRGYTSWEAAGLLWLAEAAADGGVRVVQVRDVELDHLDLELLSPVPPSNLQADDFGAALAVTHLAGADAFGAPPARWTSHGWFGPATEPLPLPLDASPTWGAFYAEQRILHTARLGLARGTWDVEGIAPFERVAERLRTGEFDDGRPPARCHGDLWSGNIMWTRQGGVLIDPAAHGGHAESDLALLMLFRGPHLARIIAAYDEVSPLADEWQERVPLHQLFPVMMHAVLFGGGYVSQSLEIARRFA